MQHTHESIKGYPPGSLERNHDGTWRVVVTTHGGYIEFTYATLVALSDEWTPVDAVRALHAYAHSLEARTAQERDLDARSRRAGERAIDIALDIHNWGCDSPYCILDVVRALEGGRL